MSEELSASQRVEKRDQYSRWINRAVGVGCAGFFVGTAAWMVTDERLALFAGLGIYWLGCLGMAAGYWHSPVSISDEFEQHTRQEASQAVSAIITVVAIVGLPADVVLSSTGIYTAPAAVRGLVWGYFLLVLVFGAAHWYVKRQYA